MKSVDSIREAVENFRKVQDSLDEFGTTDTEPERIFQVRLKWALQGKQFELPSTADGWDLYSEEEGSDAAAQQLYFAARKVVDLISACPLGESEEVRLYLQKVCDRVSF
jgi:hypothetical protein